MLDRHNKKYYNKFGYSVKKLSERNGTVYKWK